MSALERYECEYLSRVRAEVAVLRPEAERDEALEENASLIAENERMRVAGAKGESRCLNMEGLGLVGTAARPVGIANAGATHRRTYDSNGAQQNRTSA
jgi:hypothetical protein